MYFTVHQAPEEPPFIEVGQQVKKGETLFIIEAMKTMNEIVACEWNNQSDSGTERRYGRVQAGIGCH